MKTHWFPLIRPAIRAGYFLGVNVAGGIGGVGPLDSHDINLPSVRSLLWDGFRLLASPELLSSTCLCPIDGWPGDCSVVDTSNTGDLTKLTNLFARFCPWVSEYHLSEENHLRCYYLIVTSHVGFHLFTSVLPSHLKVSWRPLSQTAKLMDDFVEKELKGLYWLK